MSSPSFNPPFWLRNPHIQTLWPKLFRKRPVLPLRHERLELADGDFIDLARVDGTLKSFPVEKVSRRGDLVDVSYQGATLDCAAKGVNCSTDAAAFTEFVREARNPLVPPTNRLRPTLATGRPARAATSSATISRGEKR